MPARPAQGRECASEGAQSRPRAHRGALEPPNPGQDRPVPGNPARKGPRTRPQRPPGRFHPTSAPRRIRRPPPRPGSLCSLCHGGGRPLKSALLADASPPSRSPHRPLSACSATPNRHRIPTRRRRDSSFSPCLSLDSGVRFTRRVSELGGRDCGCKYGSHLTPGLARGQVYAVVLTSFLTGSFRAGGLAGTGAVMTSQGVLLPIPQPWCGRRGCRSQG